MWEKLDAHWQKLVWGRKSRRNKQGGIIQEEARIDLRNDATGEIINLTATAPPEGDLAREIELAVQRQFALRADAVLTNPDLQDLLREKQRLEGDLETVILRLEQARGLAEIKAATPCEASGGEPT